MSMEQKKDDSETPNDEEVKDPEKGNLHHLSVDKSLKDVTFPSQPRLYNEPHRDGSGLLR